MRAMLNIRNKFGVLCDIKFNCIKLPWGLVWKLCGSRVAEFELGGIVVSRCDTIPYLEIDFIFKSSLGVDYKKRT